MVFAPPQITKFPNFTRYLPENARSLHDNCPKNIFDFFFGGGTRSPCLPTLPSPTPMPVLLLMVVVRVVVVQPPFDGEDEDDLMTSITDYAVSFPRFMSKESITICTAVSCRPSPLHQTHIAAF